MRSTYPAPTPPGRTIPAGADQLCTGADLDAVSAGKRSDGDAVKWVIAYDGSGRASGVTAPAATAGATQQSSTLTYTAAATGQAFGQWGETRLSVSGLSQPNGYAKKVRFDDSFRTRESTDTAGFVTVTAYDGASDRVSYVDTMSGTAVAMRTSTVYDSAVVFNNLSRPVGTYGPAPVAKFQTNSPLPLATETGNVAATTTTYDGGLNGLAAAWFDDNAAGPFMTYPVRPAFVGAPKAHSLQSTSASWNWGAGSPDSSVGVDNWSRRLSGLVNLATAGSWRFRGTADDGVRVIVDDKVVMSGWDQPSVTVTGDPQTFGAGWHRIVIEVKENTGNASASVEWLAPGGSWAVIPAASLKPDLGLVTSTVGADGVTTTTGYSDPVGAKPTTVSVDPTGLNLTDTTGWEARGATGQYMRRTSRSLAAGSSSTNTYTYYGASETPSAPSCAGSGVSVTPVAQRGFAKTSRAADPTTSGGTGGLLREQIVDAAGRVVASRVSTDTKWSCVSYDSRGRATVTTSPASATAPGTAGNLPPSGTRSIAQHSGYCMNVRNGTATNGEVVEQYGCFTSGQPSEIFNYVDVDGTWFTIRPSHSSMCVGATGTSDAASVTQQTCAASSLQYWKAVAASNGYQLINQASGKCLQIADFNGSEGAAASVSSCITGWTNQQWKFVNPSTLNPEPFPTGSGPSSYPERTVTSVYAVGGDPMLSTVTDPVGTISTRVDLLGRVTDVGDTVGVITHTDYDTAGRVSLVTVFHASSGAVIERSSATYNTTGTGVNAMATQRWSNTAATITGYNTTTLTPTVAFAAPSSWSTLSTLHYDTVGRNDYSDFLNGVRTTNGFDGFNRPVSVTHTKGASTLYSDVVTRDKTGRVVDRSVNGVDPRPGNPNYVYDAAGRLTDWWERDVAGSANVSGTYRFAYSGSNYTTTCNGVTGGSSVAGKNSNRVEETLTTSGGTVSSVYCYDYADRIRKVAKSSGTNPYTGGFVYDAHGNTTTVGGDVMSFDGANRHLKTVNGSTTVEYSRDAADRIVSRKVNGTVVSKQAYTGAGDSSAVTLNAAGTVTEITVGLAGGGLYTWRPSGGDVWSHGNTHGDLVLTCTTAGVQTGTIGAYDPFGNPLGVTSIDNSAGNFDYGWHGQAQRPLEHETGIQATIEMGARPYQPTLGRFLTIDPIEGGTPNDYLYVTDPINGNDLDGRGTKDKNRWRYQISEVPGSLVFRGDTGDSRGSLLTPLEWTTYTQRWQVKITVYDPKTRRYWSQYLYISATRKKFTQAIYNPLKTGDPTTPGPSATFHRTSCAFAYGAYTWDRGTRVPSNYASISRTEMGTHLYERSLCQRIQSTISYP